MDDELIWDCKADPPQLILAIINIGFNSYNNYE